MNHQVSGFPHPWFSIDPGIPIDPDPTDPSSPLRWKRSMEVEGAVKSRDRGNVFFFFFFFFFFLNQLLWMLLILWFTMIDNGQ